MRGVWTSPAPPQIPDAVLGRVILLTHQLIRKDLLTFQSRFLGGTTIISKAMRMVHPRTFTLPELIV